MIADLHSGHLDRDTWGAKAANLALLASAGIAVPPGLCLWPTFLRGTARHVAVGAWLSECRARSLVVRSSTAEEDGDDVAGAGRSSTLTSVPPDVASVDAAITSVAAGASAAHLDLRSVIVQEEVPSILSGVAFYTRQTGELLVEADSERFAVTGGSRVTTHVRVDGDGLVVYRGSLSAIEARALRDLAVACADLLDRDPDIEWGYLGGAFVVFQARPITRSADG